MTFNIRLLQQYAPFLQLGAEIRVNAYKGLVFDAVFR